MLLIALVSVGGFTVLAQRRLRAIGMLERSAPQTSTFVSSSARMAGSSA